MSQEESDNGPLESARTRRADLKAALSAVEIAAASPAGAEGWSAELGAALVGLREAFDDHVREVEDPGGLLDALRDDAPHLAHQINEVQEEHPAVEAQIDEASEMLRGDATPEEIRDAVLAALSAIARHRQHGADLVYHAYSVDIGGE